MGPTANRFITRQIHTHLNKEPAELTTEDIVVLTDWIKIEISLLTEDSNVIEEFTENLLKLSHK